MLPYRGPSILLLALLAAAASLLAVQGGENAGVVVLSEIMYHPPGGDRDLEYVEIRNRSPAPVDISDWYFSRGIEFRIPEGTILPGGSILAICARAERVRSLYGIENAIGDWAGEDGAAGSSALSNRGEVLELSEPGGVVHARVRYRDDGRWTAAADGTGHSLEILDAYGVLDEPESWYVSRDRFLSADGPERPGGSPGRPNTSAASLAERPPLRINEVLLFTHGPRWIEIHNASDAEVDASGYHLSADRGDLLRFRLPAGSLISPRGWMVVSEAELGFDLCPSTDAPPGAQGPSPPAAFLALTSPDGSRVVDALNLRPTCAERSSARIPDGGLEISDAALPTPGEANNTGAESDVVVSEIMYHPMDDRAEGEYIELFNRGERRADLSGWAFTSGIEYRFPEGLSIGPGEHLVVARHPEWIRANYDLPAASVVGPVAGDAGAIEDFGVLKNSGKRISLRDDFGNLVDEVVYRDGGSWPSWCDGGGSSLELIDPFQDGSAGAAWDASDGCGRSPVGEFAYEGVYRGGEPELHLLLLDRGIAIVDDISVKERFVSAAAREVLIDRGDRWRFFRGRSEPSSPSGLWRQPEFDDSGWETGPAPIGYGCGGEEVILDDMRGSYVSLFLRREFHVESVDDIGDLILEIEYDDGFAAYLNSAPIASANAGVESPAFDAPAVESLAEPAAEIVQIESWRDLLREGRNVLAVQVHNADIASGDFRFDARLVRGDLIVEEGPELLPSGSIEAPLASGGASPGDWRIEGTHAASGRSLRDPISGAASLAVIATGKGDDKANRLEVALPALRTDLRYAISFRARWVAGSPRLLTHGWQGYDLAKSHRLIVPERLGTPGAPNSVSLRLERSTGSCNLGPVIDDVRQTPVQPAPGEDVEISARISDPDGVSWAAVRWSEDGSLLPEDPRFNEAAMDGPSAGGRFRARLPGLPRGTAVVFSIVAEDGSGRRGRFPVDPRERSHPLILDVAHPGPLDIPLLNYRHEDREDPAEGSLPVYRFWMRAAGQEYLDRSPLLSNDPVEGSLVVDDRIVHHRTRVRFAGSPFARQAWSGSYRVSLAGDQLLFGAIRRFNAEEHQGEGAVDGRERISSYLLR
ncbi:MAG: lamin tail domain-containing protein, partial [Planctomycetes bacterium]|nr:lamin tail domain-containing protein [Planctomycetota bacterium]